MENRNNRPPLVFWFDRTPRVEAGSFHYVAEEWPNRVYFFCMDHMMDYRKEAGWKEETFEFANVVYFAELDDPEYFFLNFISKNPDAIHIFNGFRSNTTKYLDIYINKQENQKIIIWSERPGVYGSKIKKILKKLLLNYLHRYIYFKYNKYITVLLPLGRKGVDTFQKFGWDRNKMYPFMYVPIGAKQLLSSKTTRENAEGIKFLYVGRFSKSTKGIDILISAVNQIKLNNWNLDLVGGYGDYKDQTLAWANSKENVNFIGSWSSDEVSKNMQEYDVVIVPSRFDGWNVVINESLAAGIGAIVSEQAVSDELIIKSKSGIVFYNNDSYDLKVAMEKVIKSPEIISEWKENSKKFYEYISDKSVGEYLIDIIESNFILDNENEIKCPWD